MFEDSAWLIWLGVALALGAVEAATVDFVFLMLAGGAVGGSVAAAAGAPLTIQVVVAALVAALLLVFVRPAVKRRFTTPRSKHAIGVAANIGRAAYVLEDVTDTGGRIRLGGETWSARSTGGDAIRPGEEVRIVAIEGATAVVARPPDPQLP